MDKDDLYDKLGDQSSCLDEVGEDFELWLEKSLDGQSAWGEFKALSVGVELPALHDLDPDRWELLFNYVQSQSKLESAWRAWYCEKGLEDYVSGLGDYLHEQQREG